MQANKTPLFSFVKCTSMWIATSNRNWTARDNSKTFYGHTMISNELQFGFLIALLKSDTNVLKYCFKDLHQFNCSAAKLHSPHMLHISIIIFHFLNSSIFVNIGKLNYCHSLKWTLHGNGKPEMIIKSRMFIKGNHASNSIFDRFP